MTNDDKALVERPCTCHADDAPSVCQKKYALNECRIKAQAAEIERLKRALWKIEFEVQQAFAPDEPLVGQAGSEA